ncbi:MAG: Gfo/Idh/MocA family oxidoreductase [Planctomycetota bacterium]
MKTTRRSFLKSAAAVAAAPCILPATALGAGDVPAPSERVTLGAVGVGHMGTGHLKGFLGLPDVQVVAVCDVWQGQRENAQKIVNEHYARQTGKEFKGCEAYVDFRELLDRRDIDVVYVATPDHWHALIAIEAAKAGKDMYVEKPMDVCIAEGRAIVDAVKRYGRVFQYGTQQRSSGNFRFACEMVRNGRIGRLHTMKVGAPSSCLGPAWKPMPVPKELAYDMWLGPAPDAPYTERRCRLGSWFHIHDYSLGGFIGGWGIHHVDIAQWGNGSDHTGPIEIQGTGTIPRDGLYDTPIDYRLECLYTNGVKMIFSDNRQNAQGVRFEGDKGWVYVDRSGLDAHPRGLLKERIGPNEIHLYESSNHRRNFIDCVKSRAQTVAPVESAHRSTTICGMSYIAILTGEKLKWDPENECFTNNADANRLLSRALRPPWRA